MHDGHGFVAEEPSGGVGLASMRERAAEVHAYELCAAESRAGEFRVDEDRAGFTSQPTQESRAM